MSRKTKRYNWDKDDFTISDDIALPEYLDQVVADAPKGDKAIGEYLTSLLNSNKITEDDVTFLIESGALG